MARRIVLLELASGITWGGMAVVGFGTGDTASHVFMLTSLIVLLAIRMTFASTLMTVLYVGTTPMTVAVVARLILKVTRSTMPWPPWRSACTFTSCFSPKASIRRRLSMLEFRAEKDALIAEIEEEKWISDEARQRPKRPTWPSRASSPP